MSVWNINYLGWGCFQKIAEFAQAEQRQTLALCNRQASRVVRKVWGSPNFKKGQLFVHLSTEHKISTVLGLPCTYYQIRKLQKKPMVTDIATEWFYPLQSGIGYEGHRYALEHERIYAIPATYEYIVHARKVKWRFSKRVDGFDLLHGALKQVVRNSDNEFYEVKKLQRGWGLVFDGEYFGNKTRYFYPFNPNEVYVRNWDAHKRGWNYGQIFVRKIMLTKAIQKIKDVKEPSPKRRKS